IHGSGGEKRSRTKIALVEVCRLWAHETFYSPGTWPKSRFRVRNVAAKALSKAGCICGTGEGDLRVRTGFNRKTSPLSEVALVLVRLDHIASRIVYVNHNLM